MSVWSRVCGVCHKSKPALGSRIFLIKGQRTWVCQSCALERKKQ